MTSIQERKSTIELPAMRRGAQVRAASYDEASNTIEICFTTGARVRRHSWLDGPFIEELVVTPQAVKLDRLNLGAPLLDTHDSFDLSRVLGVVVPGSAKIITGRGICRVQLSDAEDVASSVAKIKEGTVRNISVGYKILKVEKTEAAAGEVPIHRVVEWEPLEISAVAIPADPGSQVRSEAPALEKVNEHGEFTRGRMGDAAEKYSIQTFGRIVGVTRQVIVNDDLNAFTRIPRAFGQQAAQLESDLVWAQLLANPNMSDGVALFHGNHGNLGTDLAIGAAAVSEARLKLGLQKGLDGSTVLNLSPVYLITSKASQTAAETYLAQIYPAKVGDAIPASLKALTLISEPRLDNGIPRYGIAGDANAFYFAADINQVDLIELAYLEGQEGVFTETRVGFDIDGVEIKCRLDVGAKALDWRGFVKTPYDGA